MKSIHRLYLVLFCLFSLQCAYAQADLVVRQVYSSSNNIDRGGYLLFSAEVINQGNEASEANYMNVFLTQDLQAWEQSELLSRVSIKALQPLDTQMVTYIYPIPTIMSVGNHYLLLQLDPLNEVAETDENNVFCQFNGTNCSPIYLNEQKVSSRKIPYPILFIHGLGSNSNTWVEFVDFVKQRYGWTYGGRLDYCLNPDGKQVTADEYINVYTDYNKLRNGDFYALNFDVSTDGEPYVSDDWTPFNEDYSNQSAIIKQSWAVRRSIQDILSITGAEKVVLVGHSMGGLAAREYLQTKGNWTAAGHHNVAKLLTIGTPHGGSNANLLGVGFIVGIDEHSEAVRDLRYSSFNFDGIYLSGGQENESPWYWNSDINCNGYVGDHIVGLNQKTVPLDMDYACIVGNFGGVGSDGVVDLDRANINNYLLAPAPYSSPHADVFTVSNHHLSMHKENPKTLIQGLDEPTFYDIAYPLTFNDINFGFSTQQAVNTPIPPSEGIVPDWDDYKIEVNQSGTLEILVTNIPTHGFALFLLDSKHQIIEEIQAIGDSNLNLKKSIGAGTYFVEMGSLPTENSWQHPYSYSIYFEGDSGELIMDFSSSSQQDCAPMTVDFFNESNWGNKWAWEFEGGTPHTSFEEHPTVVYSSAGTYRVSLTAAEGDTQNSISRNGYIWVMDKPNAAFSFDTDTSEGSDGLTVDFQNLTSYSIDIPTYLWAFGDGTTSTAQSPIHSFAASGVYAVTLTATNSCGNSVFVGEVEVSEDSLTDIEAVDVANGEAVQVGIVPNPNNGLFELHIDGAKGKGNLQIVNSLGQVVWSQKEVDLLESGEMVDVSELPNGVYLLQIETKDWSVVRRWVKD